MKNIIFSLMAIALLSGCASNGIAFSKSALALFTAAEIFKDDEVKVILLPEEDGKVGVISLTDDKGKEYTINKPYEALNVSNGKIKESVSSKQEVSLLYGDLLKALPKKLQNYYFFFDTGSSTLNQIQTAQIESIIKAISSNVVHKIICIGHSDSTGTKAINERISKNRAKAVADQLIASGINKELIKLEYYGDAVPLVKTKAGESNAKNRRVEVVLK